MPFNPLWSFAQHRQHRSYLRAARQCCARGWAAPRSVAVTVSPAPLSATLSSHRNSCQQWKCRIYRGKRRGWAGGRGGEGRGIKIFCSVRLLFCDRNKAQQYPKRPGMCSGWGAQQHPRARPGALRWVPAGPGPGRWAAAADEHWAPRGAADGTQRGPDLSGGNEPGGPAGPEETWMKGKVTTCSDCVLSWSSKIGCRKEEAECS